MEPTTDAPAPEKAVTGAHAPGGRALTVQARLRLALILILLFIASGWVAKQLAVPPANVTMLWLPSG
ncbi:hypothetical protein K4H03_27660, partial [Mycobacterium tuberculosis]|nr:hypothetical protein [Mycobacterium tuberculosis]